MDKGNRRKKAALLTWCYNNGKTNYGQILQCYAVQVAVQRLGYDTKVIRYRKRAPEETPDRGGKSGVLDDLYELWYRLKTVEGKADIRILRFIKFIREHISLSGQCYTKGDVEAECRDCGVLFCGSDQIWNPLWFDDVYALDFGRQDQKRIAYAPSGILAENEQAQAVYQEIGRRLERFDWITVRERKSVEILKRYTQKPVADAVDQRVGICPMLPCHACPSCRKGRYGLCVNYGYLGSERNGGFAEYAVVMADNLLRLPKSVSNEEAAMMEPMAAAVHAMRKAGSVPDDMVVVYGMDTIGVLLTMCLRDAGVKNVYAIGSGEGQMQAVERTGFPMENYCDSSCGDSLEWVKECTEGKGADVLYECTGKSEMILQAVEAMAPMGRICLVGKPHSDVELGKHAYERIRKDQLSLRGSWGSAFTGEGDDWHYALDRLSKKMIVPAQLISQRYSIENLGEGFRTLRDSKGDCMKIMMVSP